MKGPPSGSAVQPTFIEQMPAHVVVFDGEMRYLAVSQRFLSDMARLFATRVFAPGEVIGLSHYQIFPNQPPRWRDLHARVLAGEEITQEEDHVPGESGTGDWVRWSMKPWRSADGRIGGMLLYSEVVTQQVEARHAVAASEARFRATFENAAVGIAHVDPYLRWLRINEAFCRILGYTREELLAKSVRDIQPDDDFAVDVLNAALMRSGKMNSAEMDKRFVRKDGSVVIGRLTVSCVRGSDGSIEYFVGILQDITWRKQAEEELRKSEERFRYSLLHSPVPIMLFDDHEEVLGVSTSWLEASGYSRDELSTIEKWTACAYGDRQRDMLAHIRAIISSASPSQPTECAVWTRDRRERFWSFVTSGLGESNGRRLFVTVAQDVTERRAHEERVHLLMREVNHRAKNMLSLVQSIAHQTAAREPAEFIARFTERIQALAANQNLLVRNEWRGVDVDDLVRAQLLPFAGLIGSRIVMDGPRLHVTATAAQAIGLVIHELATNAGKYGALSTDAGEVEISWQVTPDDTFTMSWVERHGPPVVPPEQRGFGSVVIEGIGTYNLKGKAELCFAASGVTWQLTCPAANALERR